MQQYFVDALAHGARRVVLLGSDSPTLPLDYIERAWASLDDHPVVLGPTQDGGYYLIGIRDEVPPIFDHIAWSTPQVWDQTVSRLHQSQIPFAELPGWYDVDCLQDLL